jgi:enterochelin esterase-like enzyme
MDAKTLKAQAQEHGSPVIAGESATFIWRGRSPAFVTGDFQNWRGKPLPLTKVSPGLWARTLTLPRDAYVEYALVDARGRRLVDPLNPRVTDNGVGGLNHFFYMPEGEPTSLVGRSRKVTLRGRVTRHQVETSELAVGRKRDVFLYEPPTPGPHPLLIVFDGQDYLRRARLAELVDNLIHERRIRPVALALVANGGLARTVEYSGSDATLLFLQDKVLRLAREKLRLVDERRKPGAHGVLGASLGGVMALYAGLRAPHVFGHVLSQSGAFVVPGFGEFGVLELAGLARKQPLSVWMDCGMFEGLIEGNRRILPVLAEAGHRVQYREYPGGHNYPAWRDDVWRGLEWLFPK